MAWVHCGLGGLCGYCENRMCLSCAMAVGVSVGYMSVGVSVGYMSVGWACGRACGRGALGERPNGEGVEWEVRGVEREWDGRRGSGMDGEGIMGLFRRRLAGG
jgi:hypothetical protein